MKNYFIQVFYWLALFLPILVSGQTVVLDQYVEQALANNLSLRTLDLSEARQVSRIEQAKKLWNTNVNLDASYLLARGGRKIIFPVGDLFNPVYGTLNELTGMQNFPTDLENFETQLTPNNFVDASLSVSKPLLNSAIKNNIRIQQAILKLADVDRKIQNNEIVFQVKQAYYNYLKTIEGKNILEVNLNLLNEVQEFNRKLVKYDKATPDVLSDVDFQIAGLESQINELDEQQKFAKTLFNILLNRDTNEDIVVDTSVYTGLNLASSNLNVLVGRALQQRSEFQNLNIADELSDLNIQRIRGESDPTVGVQAGIGIQTEDFSIDDGGPLYTLGLSVGWNIVDGGLRKKKIEELSIEKEESALQRELLTQQVTIQVSQAFHNLEALYAKLIAQEKQIDAASTSYTAIDRKYRNEKALLIELINAQNQLTNSELNKLVTIIDILIAQAELDKVLNNQQ